MNPPDPHAGKPAPAAPVDLRPPSIPQPSGRPATLGEVFKAVFWSFFGVRRGDAMRKDAISIRPQQVIVVGILLAAAFVATLLVIVQIVLRSAGVK